MKVCLYPIASILFVFLTACGGMSVESKKIDYKSATTVQTRSLEVPPDLTAPERDERFSVPDTGGKGTATFSSYASERTPEQLAARGSVLPAAEKIRIERQGNVRWLVVAESPDKLWGTIKDFWQEAGFLINVERPEAGVIETDWAENRAKIQGDLLRNLLGRVIDSFYSTAERDKFRTRLEPGEQPGTTDIYISHRGVQELYVSEGRDQTKWQPREADKELEAEMLRRLMVYIGADQKRAEAEILATQGRPTEQARLLTGDGGAERLDVLEPFDRAWRRVGLALDRMGFTVEDRDRSSGIYFVRYVDPDAPQGGNFLSRLFSGSGPSDAPPARFRIEMQRDGATTQVRAVPAEKADKSAGTLETVRKIHGLLFEQLK